MPTSLQAFMSASNSILDYRGLSPLNETGLGASIK